LSKAAGFLISNTIIFWPWCKNEQVLVTEPIRITHVITGLATGGAETMLLKLLTGMDSTRFQNRVISLTDSGPIGDSIRKLGIPLITLRMNRSIPTPWDIVRLYWQIRNHKPHIVQTWLYHADLLGYFAARISGVKNIAWNIRCSYMGEEYYKGVSGLVIRLLAAISAKPEAVIVNSAAGQSLHQSLGYTPRNWLIIPNGFDLSIFRPSPENRQRVRRELKIPKNAPVIGMVGRWDPVKGHDFFLNAAAAYQRQQPDCHFIVFGKGCSYDNADLMELVANDLKPNLHLLGERQDVADVTASFDLAVCASLGEGFPNVLGEAMACEVPCVATDVGDCAEIISDTGRVVSSGDVTSMVNAWLELLTMPRSELDVLGARARARVSEVYAIKTIINKYQDVYQAMAAS
jgi:glycosyltransferase involved in cell wall biosynthesis